jgi:hypothetical protein
MKTTYFQVEDKLYEQKDGVAMGSPLSPLVSNVSTESFNSINHSTCVVLMRCADNTFVIWPHGCDKLHKFLNHLNNLSLSNHLVWNGNRKGQYSPIFGCLDNKKRTLSTRVYKKTHPSSFSFHPYTTRDTRNSPGFIQYNSHDLSRSKGIEKRNIICA